MTAPDLFKKRKSLFLGVLLIAFLTFTGDILDLREELRILSCPFNYLDSNITTGIIHTAAFSPKPILTAVSDKKNASVTISFIHLIPYGFRAPPTMS